MKRVFCVCLCALLLCSFNIDCRAVDISAESAVVVNGDTNEVIFSHNKDKRLPMASTTKIMTALLLCEMVEDFSETLVTTREMVTVEGSSMGLLEGDTVSYRDLLYGMMLASGNDAANTTAIALSGSVEAFVERMNARARELGLYDTHFQTPSGLDGKEHYTTAYELALLSSFAMKNQAFSEAVGAESAELCYGNPPYNRTLTNHNKLLKSYSDVVGVKTGFTKKSGRCLVSAARKDNKYVIVVTLNDKNDWADHRALIDFAFSNIKVQNVTVGKGFIKIPVSSGEELKSEIEDVSISTQKTENITYKISAPRFLNVPIETGQTIGEIKYFSGDNLLLSKKISAQRDYNIKVNNFKVLLSVFKNIFCGVN